MDLDVAVLDWEDGVALSEKDNARRLVAHALSSTSFGRTERCIRINSRLSPYYECV